MRNKDDTVVKSEANMSAKGNKLTSYITYEPIKNHRNVLFFSIRLDREKKTIEKCLIFFLYVFI